MGEDCKIILKKVDTFDSGWESTRVAIPKKSMTELEIASRIKAGRNFWVPGNRERKLVLMAARFFGVRLSTRVSAAGGFTVYFFAE